jgi:glucosamine-6-phosphate deaminase
LDEYAGLAPDHPQSFNRFMMQNFFSQININPLHTHIPDGMNQDHDQECKKYDNLIRSLGGIDLQLLGIGHNGHIGFNEPGTAFEKETHYIRLSECTVQANARFFPSAGHVPTHAYTLGMKAIMQARRILLAANGKDKAQILKKAFVGPISPALPASILQLHPDLTIIADQEALADLISEDSNIL